MIKPQKEEGKTMKLLKYKRSMLILISLSLIFALGVMTSIAQEKQIRDFLRTKGMTPGAQETRKAKFFNHVTKMEGLPIPDAEGHFVGMVVREGVNIYDDGELGWQKSVITFDATKGGVSFSQYTTVTFQDESTTTSYTKGTQSGPAFQFTGEIIHGTGRFQGIKGTVTATGKMLPVQKGEIGPKAVGEFTLTFTLPPK
jgi:hypothetical protein